MNPRQLRGQQSGGRADFAFHDVFTGRWDRVTLGTGEMLRLSIVLVLVLDPYVSPV
jgi:hypothetical protein